MSDLDIGPYLALGQGLARAAITTSGTTVRFEDRATTTDLETLTETVTATPVGTSVPGIVAPVGGATAELVPGVELRTSDWKVVLTPDVTPPAPGVWVVVEMSRDPNLTSTAAKVLGHTVSSAGAVLTVYARPRAAG